MIQRLIARSVETDMNRFGSHPIQENLTYTKDSFLRASPRHGGLGVSFNFLFTDPPWGCPVGAVAIVEPEGQNGNYPRIIAEY